MAGKVNEWMQIGVRLTNCRQNRNMTQEEMARRLGVTPQAVSKWERGMSLPDVSILLDIARLLGVSTDWLLGAEALAQRIRERIERKDNFYVLLHDRKQQGVNRILS